MTARGKFIAIEGIDGAGTSTQAELLCEALRGKGVDVLLTAEPSDGEVGKIIREILQGDIETSPDALALLFAADRVEHWRNLIKPVLEKGASVVSDRYLLSSIAYQSLASDAEWVRDINSKVAAPDVTILLDLPVEEALIRLESRGESREIFEKKETLQKIRESYLYAAKHESVGPVTILQASHSIEEVHKKILILVKEGAF